MNMLIVLVSLLCVVTSLPQNGRVGVSTAVEMISSEGYGNEVHHVVTEDGYILEMHRIPVGKSSQQVADRPVVFVMHGLLTNSIAFLALGPQLSLGYHLADVGFDVWMGNARGTRDSRRHMTLDPDHPDTRAEFWDFSWHEIGSIDVPTMIDYVLQATGQEKLHYIGHSQGGTSFLVMNSVKPEYNDKILTANLLAGVGYMEYFPDEELIAAARLTDFIYSLSKTLGIYELFPPTTDSASRKADQCTGDANLGDFCVSVGMRNILDEDITDYIAGASMKQIAHFGQNIRDKTFRQFDYGTEKNLELYGQPTPPEYDLSLITCNTTMHYSLNDHLLHENDVLSMEKVMPNTIAQRVPRESFTHNDFVVADDAKELVTNLVIENIWQVEVALRTDEFLLTTPPSPNPDVDEGYPGSAPGITSGILLPMLILTYIIL